MTDPIVLYYIAVGVVVAEAWTRCLISEQVEDSIFHWSFYVLCVLGWLILVPIAAVYIVLKFREKSDDD